jgi:peroxiredoxin
VLNAPDFALYDQYGTLFTLRQLEGHPVVLIVSSMEGLDYSRQWGLAIREKYENSVYILGVADARGIPSSMERMARQFFKKEEISILLDWKGYVTDAYGLSKGDSNIVLIDRKRVIRYNYAGEASRKAIDAFSHEADSLVSSGKEDPLLRKAD